MIWIQLTTSIGRAMWWWDPDIAAACIEVHQKFLRISLVANCDLTIVWSLQMTEFVEKIFSNSRMCKNVTNKQWKVTHVMEVVQSKPILTPVTISTDFGWWIVAVVISSGDTITAGYMNIPWCSIPGSSVADDTASLCARLTECDAYTAWNMEWPHRIH